MRLKASPGIVATVAFGLLAFAPLPGDGASATCAPSLLRFEDGRTGVRVAPGETVTLTSSGYVQGCADGGDAGPGCAPPEHEQPSEEAVELWLRQEGEKQLLGTADPRNVGDDFGRVTWTVTIPADVATGRATLLPDGGLDLTIQIVEE